MEAIDAYLELAREASLVTAKIEETQFWLGKIDGDD